MNKKLYLAKTIGYTIVYGIVATHLVAHTAGGLLVSIAALKDVFKK